MKLNLTSDLPKEPGYYLVLAPEDFPPRFCYLAIVKKRMCLGIKGEFKPLKNLIGYFYSKKIDWNIKYKKLSEQP